MIGLLRARVRAAWIATCVAVALVVFAPGLAEAQNAWNDFQRCNPGVFTDATQPPWIAGQDNRCHAALGYHFYQRTRCFDGMPVLGLQRDIVTFGGGREFPAPGYQCLQTPYWSPQINMAWLDGAADRRSSFLMLTPLDQCDAVMRQDRAAAARYGSLTMLGQETAHLMWRRGYVLVGDRLLPPGHPDITPEALRCGRRLPLPVITLPPATTGPPSVPPINNGLVNFGRGCRTFGNSASLRLSNCNPAGLEQMGAGGTCMMLGGGLTIDGLNRCTDEANPNNQNWGIVEATGGTYLGVAGGGCLITGAGTLVGSTTLVGAGGTVCAAAPPVAACVLVGTVAYVGTRQVDNCTGGRISGGIAVGMCGVGDFFANVCYRSWTSEGGNWDLTSTMAEDCGRGWGPGGTPRQTLRGPAQCGGGNVRANNVDPPYQGDGGDDLGGCSLGARSTGAAWLLVIGLGALGLRRRRKR